MLRIHLLESFEVWRDDHLIAPDEWRTRKARALMKILVHERGRPVLFERLRELLWPKKSPRAALNCLHTHLVYLRRALEGHAHVQRVSPYIRRRDSGYLFLRGSVSVDVDEFEALCRAGQGSLRDGKHEAAVRVLEQAARLYRGDYLAEDVYEEWTAETREWLREQYLGALVALGSAYVVIRRYMEAADTVRLVIERDPFREQAYRLLMTAEYFRGEKAEALLTYRRLTNLLAAELKTEPARQTKALVQAIELDLLMQETPLLLDGLPLAVTSSERQPS